MDNFHDMGNFGQAHTVHLTVVDGLILIHAMGAGGREMHAKANSIWIEGTRLCWTLDHMPAGVDVT